MSKSGPRPFLIYGSFFYSNFCSLDSGCNEAMRVQMELQRRLHEQLEASFRNCEMSFRFFSSAVKQYHIVFSLTALQCDFFGVKSVDCGGNTNLN